MKKEEMSVEMNDKEIVYSQAIKAGKRIYYMDVKKNRKDEMFLAITESKKVINGEGDDVQVSFEKHKIFLYKEDFNKFMKGLEQSIAFITKDEKNSLQPEEEKKAESLNECLINELEENENLNSDCISSKIKIDIDFE